MNLQTSCHHPLRFDADKCDGCMACMRACPTAAVRIRYKRAWMLADRCIDCGECIRVCPGRAVVPLTDQMADLSRFSCRVAIPSPVLYAQFDPDVSPGEVVAALKLCGFDDVEGPSRACDMVAAATEIFLSEYRGQYPLISSFCPTVVRLVQVNYPALVEQVLPVRAPREISAREAKARKAAETGLPEESIGAVYITPCPAKMVAIIEHPGLERSYLDAAVSISDLFRPLATAIAKAHIGASTAAKPAARSETSSGVNWAFLGASPRSLPAADSISVAGLPNVIRILDDVEKGKLRGYRFIECHACVEGCVGGCLTVENPYVARSKTIRLTQKLPAASLELRSEVERRWQNREFFTDMAFSARPLRPLDENISAAIAKMTQKEALLSELPGIDCGACGAPSCHAFAEDVVQGETDKRVCVFSLQRALAAQVEELASLVHGTPRPAGGEGP
jgi:ferredoxin